MPIFRSFKEKVYIIWKEAQQLLYTDTQTNVEQKKTGWSKTCFHENNNHMEID